MDAAAAHNPARSVRLIAADIKLAHSVFALPFALLAAVMAALGPTGGTYFVSADGAGEQWTRHPYLHPDYTHAFWGEFLGQMTLIILAMIFARTCAMLANRLLDRKLDANNPRTAGRALPSGKLPTAHAVGGILVCAALFMAVCASFELFYDNPWPIVLGLPVLIWICAYALFKRFTWLCHVYLGASLAISPLAAALAVQPEALMHQPALWLLSAMVLCWVAGFDVIYALQDIEVDRRDGLHSIPARFGFKGSLWFARALHVLAAAALIAMLVVDARLAVSFSIGVAATLALLLVEHATVARWGTTRIAITFFAINGVISCVLGILGIADVVL
jgi:4-hydroxybenzoate polyprenyltransferase